MRRIWMLLPVLALSACLLEDKDDDDDDDEDDGDDSGLYVDGDTDTDSDSDTDTDTDSDTDTDTDTDSDTDTDPDPDPGEPWSPDVVYFQYEFTLDGGDLAEYIYDGTAYPGVAYIWFVNSSRWDGTEDTENGCVVALDLAEGVGSPASGFSSYWFGWAPDSSGALVGYSDSCDNTDLRAHPSQIVADHDWAFGSGALSADLESELEGAYGADWAVYSASAFGGYVGIDGDVGELSYGLAFEITSSNELVVNSDGTLEFRDLGSSSSRSDGYFRAFPAYGVEATAL